jgi:hypothetical protein
MAGSAEAPRPHFDLEQGRRWRFSLRLMHLSARALGAARRLPHNAGKCRLVTHLEFR